jgi:hypothetical protein
MVISIHYFYDSGAKYFARLGWQEYYAGLLEAKREYFVESSGREKTWMQMKWGRL